MVRSLSLAKLSETTYVQFIKCHLVGSHDEKCWCLGDQLCSSALEKCRLMLCSKTKGLIAIHFEPCQVNVHSERHGLGVLN